MRALKSPCKFQKAATACGTLRMGFHEMGHGGGIVKDRCVLGGKK